MTLEIEPVEGGLRLAGELDLASEPRVTEALAPLVAGDEDVALDMSELSFIDSSGVRALLRAASSLEGRRLILRAPSPTVLRVFGLMRLDAVPNLEIVEEERPS